MAKKKEELVDVNFKIDDTQEEETPQVVVPVSEPKHEPEKAPVSAKVDEKRLVNCLRNEKVIVRHVRRQKGNITDPRHVLYGGMSINAKHEYSVPKLRDGRYADVLTDAEKDYLEYIMGLEHNALSIYRKVNNYWNAGENPAAIVTVRKEDLTLDLSDPVQYIQYKILLANKMYIASSPQELQDHPKLTYQHVLISREDENKVAQRGMTNIMRCYTEYGKIMEDKWKLRFIVETLTGKPVADNVKIEFLQTQTNDLIQADSKMFLSVITDKDLDTKILIRKAVDAGLIAQRANQFYYRETNTPLCDYNEEATLSNAAKYLTQPKHQDMLFALQAKLNK